MIDCHFFPFKGFLLSFSCHINTVDYYNAILNICFAYILFCWQLLEFSLVNHTSYFSMWFGWGSGSGYVWPWPSWKSTVPSGYNSWMNIWPKLHKSSLAGYSQYLYLPDKELCFFVLNWELWGYKSGDPHSLLVTARKTKASDRDQVLMAWSGPLESNVPQNKFISVLFRYIIQW